MIVNIFLYISIRFLLRVLSLVDRVCVAVHEHLCHRFRLSPCQVYGPGDSAVVLVGGNDASGPRTTPACPADLGRHIALDFSQQGHTVFALFPSSPHTRSPPDTDRSNVSLFIQEWHQRMKRSGQPSSHWGLVAPIVLDMKSEAQRKRAVETIDAFCEAHGLHLVALVVFPASVADPVQNDPFSLSVWCNVLQECLIEPLSLVHDYLGALTAASGRVVILSTDRQRLPASLHELQDTTLLSTAQYLRQELEPKGIKVSTIFTGPSAPLMSSDTAPSIMSAIRKFASSTRGNTFREVLTKFVVAHEDVWQTLQTITRSPYPKGHYNVGLHAHLLGIGSLMPMFLHLYLRSIIPYDPL